MLHARHPRPERGFEVEDGLRGVTSQVDIKAGNGWLVTDTIGMGETQEGTVTTEDAEAQLCKFLKQLKFKYSHIIYVVKKGRMEDAQSATWDMFKKMFEGGEQNFVVVFTSADEAWLATNLSHIRRDFSGCERFVAVDRPPVSANEQMERLLENQKLQSITALEQKLESYSLQPVFRKLSRMSDVELLEHVKMTIRDALQHISRAVDNPITWVLKQVLGKF